MSENTWAGDRPEPPADEPRTPANIIAGMSLRDYVEREFAAIDAAGGPTMAEWLDKVHQLPIQGPSTEEIVAELHAARREREEHLDSLWKR